MWMSCVVRSTHFYANPFCHSIKLAFRKGTNQYYLCVWRIIIHIETVLMCGDGMCSWTCLRWDHRQKRMVRKTSLISSTRQAQPKKILALKWFRPFRVSIIYFRYVSAHSGVFMGAVFTWTGIKLSLSISFSLSFINQQPILEFFRLSFIISLFLSQNIHRLLR